MFTKEWHAQFLDKQIIVTNSWGVNASLEPDSGAAKLYIENECVDTNTSAFLLANLPALRGKISTDSGSYRVEVLMKSGFFGMKVKILVDGQEVAISTV